MVTILPLDPMLHTVSLRVTTMRLVTMLYVQPSGTNNCAIGRGTLRQNTTGGYNVAPGYFALHLNTTADGNTAVGWEA